MMTEEQKNKMTEMNLIFIEEKRKLKQLLKEGKISQEEFANKSLELRMMYLSANAHYGI